MATHSPVPLPPPPPHIDALRSGTGRDSSEPVDRTRWFWWLVARWLARPPPEPQLNPRAASTAQPLVCSKAPPRTASCRRLASRYQLGRPPVTAPPRSGRLDRPRRVDRWLAWTELGGRLVSAEIGSLVPDPAVPRRRPVPLSASTRRRCHRQHRPAGPAGLVPLKSHRRPRALMSDRRSRALMSDRRSRALMSG